jgi:hypothetical protein
MKSIMTFAWLRIKRQIKLIHLTMIENEWEEWLRFSGGPLSDGHFLLYKEAMEEIERERQKIYDQPI